MSQWYKSAGSTSKRHAHSWGRSCIPISSIFSISAPCDLMVSWDTECSIFCGMDRLENGSPLGSARLPTLKSVWSLFILELVALLLGCDIDRLYFVLGCVRPNAADGVVAFFCSPCASSLAFIWEHVDFNRTSYPFCCCSDWLLVQSGWTGLQDCGWHDCCCCCSLSFSLSSLSWNALKPKSTNSKQLWSNIAKHPWMIL